MKLIGDLKKQVEQAKNKEEAKDIIKNAGMLLTDSELDEITDAGFFGGVTPRTYGVCICGRRGKVGNLCPNCGSYFN